MTPPYFLTRARKVYVFRAGIDIVNGISANQPATSCCVDLGDRKLVDLKFLNDKSLVVLCNEPGNPFLSLSPFFLSPLTSSIPAVIHTFRDCRKTQLTLVLDHVLVVVSIPVQSAKLDYTPLSVYGPGGTGSVTILISTHGFAEYRLPVQQAVRPVKMEVHDRSDVRGEIPKRICLLGSNRTTWQTFSIPHEDP